MVVRVLYEVPDLVGELYMVGFDDEGGLDELGGWCEWRGCLVLTVKDGLFRGSSGWERGNESFAMFNSCC